MFLMPGSRARARSNVFGVPTLVNTIVAASNTPQDTTSFSTNCTAYDIVFINIITNTNAGTLVMQLQSGGSFQTTSYHAIISETNDVNATTTNTAFTTGLPLTNTSNTNTTQPGISGRFTIVNPTNITIRKSVYGTSNSNSNGAAARLAQVSGFWDGGNGAITGFRLQMASGNITSGTIKVYRIP